MHKISNAPPSVELRQREVGPWGLNAHVLVCARSRQSVLIDPGAEPDLLRELVSGTTPVAILITHRHPDHIGALKPMREALNVPVMAHPGNGGHDDGIDVDRALSHDDRVPLGKLMLRIYHTPGHTDDQICVAVEDDSRIIVGDTIFEGGPGKTWSAADFRTTLHTLRNTVLGWPDDTRCFPGHGPAFRLGDKRALIEEFVQKDHGPFFGDAFWEM